MTEIYVKLLPVIIMEEQKNSEKLNLNDGSTLIKLNKLIFAKP